MRDYIIPTLVMLGVLAVFVVIIHFFPPYVMIEDVGWKQWQTDHENACIECLDRNGFPNWTYGDWDNISPYMQKVCPCCKPLTLESSAYGCED